ncbi:TPA: LPD7 domain-containing protein [Neisseria meningitidis]|uniref:LPD7 domain-containing protein n=1 Tax=Neisseria meningitidis TaxID=487 RepID=UPI00038AA236|nr:LPD7 domain-containing protein [Neisseria meningitidis]EQD18286.1 toprim domain protein [Neisseria meningitidis NM3173]CWN76135.1 TraC [Neisseria meningitidis]CWR65431.1 TraC [Neisseria meningitidis]
MSDYNEIRNALNHLDANDRDFWVKIGAAVKDELGEDGFELWDEWSRHSENYKSNDAKAVWKSLKQGHIHIGTLFYHARKNGYRPNKPYTPPSAEELAKRAAETQEKQRAETERIAQAHAKAEKTAYGIWKNASPADPNHAYARTKGLGINTDVLSGIRQNEYQGKKQLVIPLYSDNKLVNVQTIDEDGHKKFLNGGQKQGAYAVIGDLKQSQDGIFLAEGFATASSVYQATKKPVVVAFDAGNLKAVSEKLINVLSENVPIYFAADNDPSHTGEHKAQAAAAIWGDRAKIILPEFTPQQIHEFQEIYGTKKVPTDFNDLHKLAGIEVVRETFGIEPEHYIIGTEADIELNRQPESKPREIRTAWNDFLQQKQGLNEYWRNEFGYGVDKLTQQEAGHLRKPTLEQIQERIEEAKIAKQNLNISENKELHHERTTETQLAETRNSEISNVSDREGSRRVETASSRSGQVSQSVFQQEQTTEQIVNQPTQSATSEKDVADFSFKETKMDNLQEHGKPDVPREELLKNNYWRVQNGYDPLPENDQKPEQTTTLGQTTYSADNPYAQWAEHDDEVRHNADSWEMRTPLTNERLAHFNQQAEQHGFTTYIENRHAELGVFQADKWVNETYHVEIDGKFKNHGSMAAYEDARDFTMSFHENDEIVHYVYTNHLDDALQQANDFLQNPAEWIKEQDLKMQAEAMQPENAPPEYDYVPEYSSDDNEGPQPEMFNGIEYGGFQRDIKQPEKQPESQPDVEEPELPRSEALEHRPILDLTYERPPKHLQSRYIVAKNGQYLSADNHTTVLFEDKGNALKTAKSDQQTIQDMLEVAKAKGWDSIKISGSPEFKSMMYVAAESQGIKTTGYKPTPADLAMVEKLREERSLNGIQSTHKPELDPKQPENAPAHQSDAATLSAADKLKTQNEMPDERQINSSPIADTEAAPKVDSLGNKTIPPEVLRSSQEMTTAALSPEVANAKAAYHQKAQQLSEPNQARLKAYERNTMDVLRDVQGDARNHALRNYYEYTTNAMNGTELNLPQPLQYQAPAHQQTHESKPSNSQGFEMER